MLNHLEDFISRNLIDSRYFKPIFTKNFYLFCLGLTFAVGDSKLIWATIVFVASMIVSYQLTKSSTNEYLQHLKQIIKFNDPKLVSSITIAGIVSTLVYFSLNLYGDFDHSSIAILAISQALFATLGIVFLSKQLFFPAPHPAQSSPSNFDELVNRLHDDSPIQRLWVINQLMNLWRENQLNPRQINQLEEYLFLLRNLELEPVILAKIDVSLQTISRNVDSQPLNIPRKIYRSRQQKSLPVVQMVNSLLDKSN